MHQDGPAGGEAREITPTSGFRRCPRCASCRCGTASLKLFACQDCGFRFYSNAAAAAMAVIPSAAGEVLLARRAREPARGKLCFPGGFVDPLESVEASLTREVREELGLEVTGLSYLTSFPNRYAYQDVTYFTLDLVFVCAVADFGALSPNQEVDEVLSLPPSAINPNELAFDSTRHALHAYLASERRPACPLTMGLRRPG